MFEYMVIGWGAVLGLLIGHAMSRSISRKRVAQAREQAARRVEDAKEEARQSLRAMKARSRETALQLRTSYEEQERQSIEENNLLQERIIKLEGRAEKKEAELSTRQAATQKRENALRQSKGESGALRRQAKEHREQSRGIVEDKAGVTGQVILNQQSEAIVEEHRAFCADRLRNLESSESDECDRQAKRLMGISLGRYRGQFLTEKFVERLPSFLLLFPERQNSNAAVHSQLLQRRGRFQCAVETDARQLVVLDDHHVLPLELGRDALEVLAPNSNGDRGDRGESRLLRRDRIGHPLGDNHLLGIGIEDAFAEQDRIGDRRGHPWPFRFVVDGELLVLRRVVAPRPRRLSPDRVDGLSSNPVSENHAALEVRASILAIQPGG